MKKIIGLIVASFLILGLGSTVLASCEEIDFGSKSVCVDLIKVNNSTYELDIDHSDYSSYTTNAYYYVLLPNKEKNKRSSGGGILSPRLGYNGGEFDYDHRDYDGYDDDIRPVKVYAIINNVVESIQMYYDFDEGDRSDESSSSSSSTNDGDLDNFYIYLSDSTPAEDDEVTLRIRARDSDNDVLSDYDGSPAEITIEYRTSSSSSRRTATSTYVSIDDKTPSFDNGIAETDITFKYEYEYRVTVTDDDENVDDYKIFDVGGTSSSTNDGDLDNFNFYYITDDTPAEDVWTSIRIEALDNKNNRIRDYEEEVTLTFEIKNGSSRNEADENDLEIDSDNFNDDENDLNSNGELNVNFENGVIGFDVKFLKNEEYRVTVEDDGENVDDYKIFDVGGTSSSTNNGDLDNFYFYLSDSTPAKDDEVTLQIRAYDNNDYILSNYDGSNAEVTIEYRTSSSSSRRTATSTYVFIEDNTPNFYNGVAETDITFKYEYEYRVTVTDDDEGVDDYKIFDVGGSSSSSNYDADNFYITTDDSTPSTNRRVDLRITARDGTSKDSEYRGEVEFIVYYRTSSSSSRRKTTSTSHFEIDNDYKDGYKFTSSDNGYVVLTDAIKFKQSYEYKVVIQDKNHNDTDGYKLFDLGNTESDVNGFTVKELEVVDTIYKGRARMINSLEDDYPDLEDNNTRQNMSDDFYDDMKDILDDRSNRTLDDYGDFVDAFKDRYNYTIDHR